MMPDPGLESALRALSLRMIEGRTDEGSTDEDLLPLDVDRTGDCAGTLIAHLRPSGVTVLHHTGFVRDRTAWQMHPMGSSVQSDIARPPGDECLTQVSSQLITSGLMPWSGSYLCSLYLNAGRDLRQLQVKRRTRPIPLHGHMIICWRSRQRITEWGPGISVSSGPGRPPTLVGITTDGRRVPISVEQGAPDGRPGSGHGRR